MKINLILNILILFLISGKVFSQAPKFDYGLSAYKEGYEVFSTLNSSNQAAAVISLRKGIESYEQRHGFRKPENFNKLIPEEFLQRTDLYYEIAYDPNNFKDEFGIKKDLTNPLRIPLKTPH